MKRQTEREQMQRLGSVNSRAFVAQHLSFDLGAGEMSLLGLCTPITHASAWWAL